jgi:hypothetical protein
VLAESMIDERESPRKSDDTSGSSDTPRMPFIGPASAARKASLISSRSSIGDVRGEVDDAHRRRRHAQAEAVELALEVRGSRGRGPSPRRSTSG